MALANNGYRVLAGLAGLRGKRNGSPRTELAVESLADALFLLLYAAGINQATFMGYSFGCQIPTMLAVRHPAVIRRLVLQGLTADPDARSLICQIGRDWLNGRRARYRSSAAIGRIDYAKAGPWRALASMHKLIRGKIEARLGLIQAPCLIVHGSRDPVAPLHWAQQACALLPHSLLLVLEGATHTLNYVDPWSFAQVIDDFLQGRDDESEGES